MKPLVVSSMCICVQVFAWQLTAAVTNITQGGAVHATIQGAVNAAMSGDTLLIGIGHYGERVLINQKSLTLKGGYLPDFVTRTNVPALTCINGGATGMTLAALSNCTVVLEYLMLTNGAAPDGGGIHIAAGVTLTAQHCVVAQNVSWAGGGAVVGAASTLVLSDTSISNNVALGGGGLAVASNGVAILGANTRIQYNSAWFGGGAYVLGTLIGESWSAFIEKNIASDGGGVAVNGGVLELRPGQVGFNQATNVTSRGGGIYVFNGGRAAVLALGDVSRNMAYNGGGIYADNARVELRATLHSNSASNFGGGICLVNGSTLFATNTFIGDTMAGRSNYAAYGGGVYALTSTVVFSGAIYNNHARISGAGICAIASTVTLYNARVGGTGTNQANHLGPDGNFGAGLYLARSIAVISNSVVASNSFQTASLAHGGGLYAVDGSVISLTDSRIEHHLIPLAINGRGAGMYVNGSSVTLNNSQIISNTAGAAGGGVRLFNGGTITMLNGSVIAYNHALNDTGGGIDSDGPSAIIISNAILRGNSAALDGGAIYLSAGTLACAGRWTFRENTAARHGGAVAVAATATADFRVFDDCFVYFNRATHGHGGMLYLGNNSTVRLYANAGHLLNIYANQAGGDGGALYASNGGYFDIYGLVTMERNRASNGGAIYLSNGSRVWLDDYVNDRPQLCDNFADFGSGGGIYAINSPNVRLTGVTMGRAGAGNYALTNGGAIAAYFSTVTVERTGLFLENTARTGGAIAASNSLVRLVAGLQLAPVFTSNTSFGTTANDGGGAIYAEHGSRLIGRNTVFCDNLSTNNGGAIWVRNASAELGADFAQWPGGGMPPLLFSNNVAISGNGGALYLSHGSAATLADTLAVDNRANFGGGVAINASTAELVNVVLYRNSAGVCMVSGRVRARHCTIIANWNDGITGAGAISVSNCIVRGQAKNVETGKDVHYSNIEGGYATGTGNIDADPLFVNTTAVNFALAPTSPCVDAGVNIGITNDCIGAKRPMNSGYDMGAYEMDPAPIQVVTPTLLDFGDVAVGDSANQPIQVRNTGNTSVNGTVLYVPIPIFTITPSAYTVAPLDATNLTATFAPLTEFAWTATVVFASNGGTQDVVLIGTGIPEPAMLALVLLFLPAVRRCASRCA